MRDLLLTDDLLELVQVGSTYKEAVNSDRILNHWETFEPIDYDDGWEDD